MIKNLYLLSALAVTICLGSCSSPMKIVASWVNTEEIKPEPYKSVFIIALTGNLEAKRAIENDLATAAEARGLKVYKSIVVFGPFSGKSSIPAKDIVSKKVAELGCEAIFTVALVDKEITTTYRPASTTVVGGGYYGGGGYYNGSYPTYPYYGSFGGYYAYSAIYYDPGYYSVDKKYALEANIYDAKTEKLIISIESKAANPSGIKKASQQYTQLLADEISRLRPVKK
ncbi:hypothetical protein [Mucilaginibacter jinjuensis]|uniref:DUF4136 domain-containing protein n=1 Tax=Mucilaginibacter jinjuensis TaxID=1176721 RepID=A0ABY7T773_9SPHI|nr:hypothetical protein [Mucilaginibacter jinjuensis]WCT11588.1 hypothetical protein PQO05_22875 [Mucilaginibacter jinjuensis]